MLAKRECGLGGDVRYAAKTLVMLASLSFALMPARGDDYTSRRLTLIAPWPPAGAVSWRQAQPSCSASRSSSRTALGRVSVCHNS